MKICVLFPLKKLACKGFLNHNNLMRNACHIAASLGAMCPYWFLYAVL